MISCWLWEKQGISISKPKYGKKLANITLMEEVEPILMENKDFEHRDTYRLSSLFGNFWFRRKGQGVSFFFWTVHLKFRDVAWDLDGTIQIGSSGEVSVRISSCKYCWNFWHFRPDSNRQQKENIRAKNSVRGSSQEIFKHDRNCATIFWTKPWCSMELTNFEYSKCIQIRSISIFSGW